MQIAQRAELIEAALVEIEMSNALDVYVTALVRRVKCERRAMVLRCGQRFNEGSRAVVAHHISRTLSDSRSRRSLADPFTRASFVSRDVRAMIYEAPAWLKIIHERRAAQSITRLSNFFNIFPIRADYLRRCKNFPFLISERDATSEDLKFNGARHRDTTSNWIKHDHTAVAA